MMLPPILDVYVVWHPEDAEGRRIATEIAEHYNGSVFTGLMSGAVDVYPRFEGWRDGSDAPRPIPLPGGSAADDSSCAQVVAVVPILGNGMAAAVEPGTGPWHDYIEAILSRHRAEPTRIGIFPVLLNEGVIDTRLGRTVGRYQSIGRSAPGVTEAPADVRCRDLTQGIAQLIGRPDQARVNVFISHTFRTALHDPTDVAQLVTLVRSTISETRLADFFDANDLQPGCDWDEQLRASAATSALLAIRTDYYASREWCQREMLIAKRAGMPIVILDALTHREDRGSFLMDHVPRVRLQQDAQGWSQAGIRNGLNLLVSEQLKRVLWEFQARLARKRAEADVTWWAPHAPEPTTLTHWLASERLAGRVLGPEPVRILHPDPPLGADECEVLEEVAVAGGLNGGLDVMTPQLLAARGGWTVGSR